MSGWMKWRRRFRKDRPVVIYCAYGGQSLLAARKLAGCGYDAVNALGDFIIIEGSIM